MHVHLREPGNEGEETIASGSAAAVASGIATVACMPNTDPAVDNEAAAEFVFLQAERAGKANVYPIGAVTKGREGKELSEIGQLSRGGAVAFSDDGDPIRNSDVMRRALEYTKMFDKPIISHCEDPDLSQGVMNEGYMAMVLGLRGMPAAAEVVMVSRDIELAEMTNGILHIAHVSTARAVELIREAKARRQAQITAEATPHHFTLTEETLASFDPVYKMSPPPRTKADVEAIRNGLKDGTIDAIASDHAPHTAEEKSVEFDYAPFGVIGLESALPVLITQLIEPGFQNHLRQMRRRGLLTVRRQAYLDSTILEKRPNTPFEKAAWLKMRGAPTSALSGSCSSTSPPRRSSMSASPP
jgi:dihydroorotase